MTRRTVAKYREDMKIPSTHQRRVRYCSNFLPTEVSNMKITYTGRHEDFPPKQREKLEAKLRKISKMLERKGEKEAHVISPGAVSAQGGDHHQLLTITRWSASARTRTCLRPCASRTEKLEKQVVKMRTKWRDTHRHEGDEGRQN